MKNDFTLHDPDTAPQGAQKFLQQAKAALGKVPNLERVMAEAPTLLEAYVKTWALFDKTSLSPIERQVVYQTANVVNGCSYCRPWHMELSLMAGLQEGEAIKLRDGQALSDPKLEALRNFTQTLIATAGHMDETAVAAFMDAGYNQQHAMEVVLGCAIKTMSNFTNALAGTPLDDEVAKWRPEN